MRRISTLMVVLGVVLAGLWGGQQARADVFAGQLHITNPDGSPFDGNFSDGTGAMLVFYLNDNASAVTLNVIDVQTSTSVATINAGALSRGANMISYDGSGTQSGKQYVFSVTAEQPNASTTEWTMFFDSGGVSIYTRGVSVIRNQSDPNFGLIMASNDGGPLGTGITVYNPDGANHDPFLVAPDVSSGGTVNYGVDAPLFAEDDEQGRLYVSAKVNGQILRVNRDFSVDTLIAGLTEPKGIYATGDGADFTLYFAADNKIWRADVGTANSVDPASLTLIGEFSGFFPQQIMLDDDGALYATLRATNDIGSDGRGIRKWDISGTLPVTDSDAVWFLFEDKTFIANDLLLDSGDDPNSSVDDILYYCTRAGGGFDQDGIWRISDINSPFADTVRVITEDALYGADDNINARATMDFDAAGNIVLMENSNEHIFFISPPGTGSTNSFTTTSAEPFLVGTVGIDDDLNGMPIAYRLEANYPNPFNPSTTIRYQLAKAAPTTLTVYNVLGKAVRTLVSEQQSAGNYSIQWDGRDNNGRAVASGVYIYTLQSGSFTESRRMALLK